MQSSPETPRECARDGEHCGPIQPRPQQPPCHSVLSCVILGPLGPQHKPVGMGTLEIVNLFFGLSPFHSLLKNCLFFILCVWCFACVYACVLHVCLMTAEIRHGHWTPWNWRSGWLQATLWALGDETMEEEWVILTTEPSLWPLS